MKRYIFGAMLFSTALAGCSLDETPISQLTETQAFSNATLTYANSVANVYSSIGNNWYGTTDNIHLLGEITSDASMLPGRQGDWVDNGKWQNLFLHNFNPSVDTFSTVWNHIYSIVGKCNSSIDLLTSLDAKGNEGFIAELRALRALYYYNACDLFANVPLVTSSTQKISEVNQSSRKEVFDFVVKELTEVMPLLSSDSSTNETSNYYGRVNKTVAYMCLAKMAINAPVFTTNVTDNTSLKAFVGGDLSKKATATDAVGDAVSNAGKSIEMTVDGKARNAWETAIYCVEQLENLGLQLSTNYADNFTISNSSSVENIWVRPNDDKKYLLWDANLMRSLHYSHAGAMGYSGWNGMCATTQAMEVMGYETADQDPRLAINYYTGKDYTKDTGGVEVDDGAGGILEYKPWEARVDFPKEGSDPHAVKRAGARFKKYEYDKTSTVQGCNNNDLVIWRYADALLIKAEAQYRLGQKDDALTNLNKVRARAGAKAMTSISYNTILNERMIELAWEGVRRQDQVRFGTFTEPTRDRYAGVQHHATAGDYTVDSEGYTNVYPIPQSVLDLNKNLKPNPGY